MLSRRWSSLALFGCSMLPALAAADSSAPIIVTATRTAQSVDDSLAAVSVVTRDDIVRLNPASLPDLLRGLPGISWTNNGGSGKSTSLFLRGTESDHTLILIDGIKVGSATLGTAALQDLPLEQIDRIEVVRGPRSSLYGSEAIGGVIQIFTRKGQGPITPELSVGGGSNDTRHASARVSGGDANNWFTLGADGMRTDGFNACAGSLSGGCYTIEPDDDGNSRRALSGRAGHRFSDTVSGDVQWSRTRSHPFFDGSYGNESHDEQQLAGGHVQIAATSKWQIDLTAGRSWDRSDSYQDGAFLSSYTTVRDSASWQNDISLGDTQLLTAGMDFQGDDISNTDGFAVTRRTNRGVFGQLQNMFGAHNVVLAARSDDNAQFDRHNTGSIGWGYPINKDLRLMASYGNAFKAPSFNELYYPGYGNPDLDPETSRTAEVGAKGRVASANWSVNVYQSSVDHLIAYDASIDAPNNVDKAQLRGLEATLGANIADWSLNSSWNWLDTENRASGANYGHMLPRRAPRSLRVDADRQFGAASVGATWMAEARRYDDLSNSNALGGYATFDLRAAYAINRDWQAQARVANVFDAQYETAALYNQPGREFDFTVRYQPRSAK